MNKNIVKITANTKPIAYTIYGEYHSLQPKHILANNHAR